MTSDFNMLRNQTVEGLLRKGPEMQGTCLIIMVPELIMETCEENARRWTEKEHMEVDTLSERVKSITDVLKRRIRQLKHSVNTKQQSICCDHEVVGELSHLPENCHISYRLSN